MPETLTVETVTARAWTKRGAAYGAPQTLRVDYHCAWGRTVSEWVCVEHPAGSFPYKKALAWWRLRSDDPMPRIADIAAAQINTSQLKKPAQILVEDQGGFSRITGKSFHKPWSQWDNPRPRSEPFRRQRTLAELKSELETLRSEVKRSHPDMGGSAERFKQVHAKYASVKKELERLRDTQRN